MTASPSLDPLPECANGPHAPELPGAFATDLITRLLAAGRLAHADKILSHAYHFAYGQTLAYLDDLDAPNILEIGYGNGAGVKFWRSVFPRAQLLCFDIDQQLEGEGFCVLKVDQSDAGALERITHDLGITFDLIIDDGSHNPHHQILSFNHLFPHLNDGGLYVFEDIETSYWRQGLLYGYQCNFGLGDPWSLIEIFKVVADLVNARFISEEDRQYLSYRLLSLGFDASLADSIFSTQFFPNLVAVKKVQNFASHMYAAAYPHQAFSRR